ncbi:hypothetical protein FOMG_18629 [Fusarium oxysporum f. sp. melonis 26406]|uniref:Uncharacterized protein n=1 Tax=Fusarium oxysporum f. sp. melonis 26406 TaxID=1089452 RepID=W9ZU86_FUSOX|nr:hypothetical protein FOMG_18629 [Fusarium oxysporum f. sp. melonis 26406]
MRRLMSSPTIMPVSSVYEAISFMTCHMQASVSSTLSRSDHSVNLSSKSSLKTPSSLNNCPTQHLREF